MSSAYYNEGERSDLQQSDGEVGVDLRGDPEPEVGVDLFLEKRVHHLLAEIEGEVEVLQHHPTTRVPHLGEDAAGGHLLTLTHRHGTVLWRNTNTNKYNTNNRLEDQKYVQDPSESSRNS